MKKLITILGILLTVTILISGSAVATYVYAIAQTNDDCTNPNNALGPPNGTYATIGRDPDILGWILLDLGSVNAMPSSQDFVVFAETLVAEDYDVWVGENTTIEYLHWVGRGTDDRNEIFTTPSEPDAGSWRYILIIGASGVKPGDYDYGPDIDAVGWDKP